MKRCRARQRNEEELRAWASVVCKVATIVQDIGTCLGDMTCGDEAGLPECAEALQVKPSRARNWRLQQMHLASRDRLGSVDEAYIVLGTSLSLNHRMS